VDLDALGPKLFAMVSNQKQGKGVFLRADEKIPYGFVVEIMSLIRQGGVFQIGMVTEPLESKPIKGVSK
jgi:biopolymer transport protein TolR